MLSCIYFSYRLDNFTPQEAKKTAQELKSQFPHEKFIIEISGGITMDTLSDFCSPDIDVISTSLFTQRYSVIDFSLKIEK